MNTTVTDDTATTAASTCLGEADVDRMVWSFVTNSVVGLVFSVPSCFFCGLVMCAYAYLHGIFWGDVDPRMRLLVWRICFNSFRTTLWIMVIPQIVVTWYYPNVYNVIVYAAFVLYSACSFAGDLPTVRKMLAEHGATMEELFSNRAFDALARGRTDAPKGVPKDEPDTVKTNPNTSDRLV